MLMIHNVNANKGMYLEELINRSCDYFSFKSDIYIEKRYLPIKIISKQNQNIKGKILNKSRLDYFAIYNNNHYEIEAKETSFEYFDCNLIKKHQWNFMIEMQKHNVESYLIIYFNKHDYILSISFKNLNKCIENNKTKILMFNQIKKFGKRIKVVFPGIIEFLHIF